jgi:hypothetical protein
LLIKPDDPARRHQQVLMLPRKLQHQELGRELRRRDGYLRNIYRWLHLNIHRYRKS